MSHWWRSAVAVLCITLIACAARVSAPVVGATPADVVDQLLRADRAFSDASAKTNLVDGLSAMFDDSVTMPLPSLAWAEGKANATAALRVNPANAQSWAVWTPLRGGVSADGLHGFTFGYMSVHKPDSTVASAKYMAYWIKRPQGWRVLAYKRAGRPAGEASTALMEPSLPARLIAPTTNATQLAAHAASLMQAEQAFSDRAQSIGVGPAFREYGTADAVNMGGGPAFVVGAENIGGPRDSAATPFAWKSDKVIVASSGDLGISFGFIRPHANPAKPIAAFFTIWRRASPSAPWRYVAE